MLKLRNLQKDKYSKLQFRCVLIHMYALVILSCLMHHLASRNKAIKKRDVSGVCFHLPFFDLMFQLQSHNRCFQIYLCHQSIYSFVFMFPLRCLLLGCPWCVFKLSAPQMKFLATTDMHLRKSREVCKITEIGIFPTVCLSQCSFFHSIGFTYFISFSVFYFLVL